MQKVDRKERASRPWLRRGLLAMALVCAAVLALALIWSLDHPRWMSDLLPSVFPAATDTPAPTATPAPALLADYEPGEAVGVTVTLQSGESWTVLPSADGGCTITWERGTFQMGTNKASWILDALDAIWYAEVLAEDLSALPDDPAAFGLTPPRETVTIGLEDGETVTFRVGGKCETDETAFYYMTLDGDPRLFSLDTDTAMVLGFGAEQLIDLEQLTLHASRMDRIALETAEGRMAWELEGDISDPDAIDRWVLSEPYRYAADGESIASLKTAVSELRLMSEIGEATGERLAAYGLDEPAAVITVHMSAGLTYEGIDWPESEVVITVGTVIDGLQRYVLVNGGVYGMLEPRLRAVLDVNASDTLTRYPVRTALSNIETLTLTDAAGETVWRVTRDEADPDASPQVVVSRGGAEEAMDWSVFSARYNGMLTAQVTGTLPEGYVQGEPHTIWRFATVTGAEHTIALSDYDGNFDAVAVDGEARFYLRKNTLSMEAGE